jgi:hypothetical protein
MNPPPDFSGIPPILEIPPPPGDIDYDEAAIKEVFEGFFRRECGKTVEIRFVASHYARFQRRLV